MALTWATMSSLRPPACGFASASGIQPCRSCGRLTAIPSRIRGSQPAIAPADDCFSFLWLLVIGLWIAVAVRVTGGVTGALSMPFSPICCTRDSIVSSSVTDVSQAGTSPCSRNAAKRSDRRCRCRRWRSFSFSRLASASSPFSWAASISVSQRRCRHPSSVSSKYSSKMVSTAPLSDGVRARASR